MRFDKQPSEQINEKESNLVNETVKKKILVEDLTISSSPTIHLFVVKKQIAKLEHPRHRPDLAPCDLQFF